MRWHMRLLMLGLLAGGLCMPVLARDAKGPKGLGEPTCGDYGTSVHFETNPKEAAKKALKEEKLVFVVHVSGLFENSDFT